MSAPSLTTSLQGMGVVSADLLNTFCQVCQNLSQLRQFVPGDNIGVLVQGFSTPGDGGAGPFWWNASAVSANFTDDNENTIVPSGALTGVWLRLGYLAAVSPNQYVVPLTGFSLTLSSGTTLLALNPAGTLATGSVTLAAPPRDGWVARISSTQAVTALTMTAASGTINNPATSLTANTPVGWQWVAAANAWFRA